MSRLPRLMTRRKREDRILVIVEQKQFSGIGPQSAVGLGEREPSPRGLAGDQAIAGNGRRHASEQYVKILCYFHACTCRTPCNCMYCCCSACPASPIESRPCMTSCFPESKSPTNTPSIWVVVRQLRKSKPPCPLCFLFSTLSRMNASADTMTNTTARTAVHSTAPMTSEEKPAKLPLHLRPSSFTSHLCMLLRTRSRADRSLRSLHLHPSCDQFGMVLWHPFTHRNLGA